MPAPKRPQRAKRDGTAAKPKVAKSSSAVPSVAAQTASLAKLSDKKLAAMFKGKAIAQPAKPTRGKSRVIGTSKIGGQTIPIQLDSPDADSADAGGDGSGTDTGSAAVGDGGTMREILDAVNDLTRFLRQVLQPD